MNTKIFNKHNKHFYNTFLRLFDRLAYLKI